MPHTVLEHLGLSSEEVRIYESLITNGTQSVTEIARSTGIHRPTVYKLLPRLREKGLVRAGARGKRQIFYAESPQVLADLYAQMGDDIGTAIRDLTSRYSVDSCKPQIWCYEGAKGIRDLNDQILRYLKPGETLYRYSSRQWNTDTKKYYSDFARTERDRKEIQRVVITSEDLQYRKTPKLNRTSKAIPKGYDLFDDNITKIIFRNRVAYIDFNTETAVVIRNKKIAEFERKIFTLLYSKL